MKVNQIMSNKLHFMFMQLVDSTGEHIQEVAKAIHELKKGNFILVYDADDREGEADFIMAAEYVTPKAIQLMRQKGGGLIFLMIAADIARHIQLPFFADVLASSEQEYPLFKELISNDIPYDARSSFSLSINHRDTYTGITDNDRSLTIKRFAELTNQIHTLDEKLARETFGNEFRSPGHVPICIASKSPLKERFGHTELSIALLTMAQMNPVAVGCEIMGDDGNALKKKDVKKYAQAHHLEFLDGEQVIRSWNNWLK